MEICLALRLVQTRSAQRGNTKSDKAEVSKRHISWAKTSRGVEIDSFKLGDPWKRYPVKDCINEGEPNRAPCMIPRSPDQGLRNRTLLEKRSSLCHLV